MQISLLDSIARQVGGAVENYNDYYRMERRATQLSTLSEISQTITSDMYLEEILQLIVSVTAESLNFKICSVMLLDEERNELVIKATQSKSREYTRKPNVKLTESVAGRAVLEAKPITIRDVRKTPGYQYPDIAKREGLCSLISVPLMVKKEIIGVLNCYTGRPHDFTDEEITVLTALANQAAISIQNAKLMVRTAVLQEMHHRVKNSLQTVASLLRLQMRMGNLDDPKEALNQSINRIQSIATVHEMLSNENLDNVSIKRLADQILYRHGPGDAARHDERGDFRAGRGLPAAERPCDLRRPHPQRAHTERGRARPSRSPRSRAERQRIARRRIHHGRGRKRRRGPARRLRLPQGPQPWPAHRRQPRPR